MFLIIRNGFSLPYFCHFQPIFAFETVQLVIVSKSIFQNPFSSSKTVNFYFWSWWKCLHLTSNVLLWLYPLYIFHLSVNIQNWWIQLIIKPSFVCYTFSRFSNLEGMCTVSTLCYLCPHISFSPSSQFHHLFTSSFCANFHLPKKCKHKL